MTKPAKSATDGALYKTALDLAAEIHEIECAGRRCERLYKKLERINDELFARGFRL